MRALRRARPSWSVLPGFASANFSAVHAFGMQVLAQNGAKMRDFLQNQHFGAMLALKR